MEVAFHSAVHRENMYNKNIELVPIVEHVSSTDSFLIEKKGPYKSNYNKQILTAYFPYSSNKHVAC